MSLSVLPGGDEAYAAALAALDVAPGRLRRLLTGLQPYQAWEMLCRGAHPADPEGSQRHAARSLDPRTAYRRCKLLGLSVLVHGDHRYPASLADDDEAPAVLFAAGDVSHSDDRLRVAVVGTRSASAAGMAFASELCGELADRGVVVVSGLATGIDSAALRAATSVSPAMAVAVLGSAHDAIATSSQRWLAQPIAAGGCVLSEVAPGSAGARWRFAVRNRIMAAMSHLVVVVECHNSGGALHTVRAARRRAVPVAAVPGSLRAPASEGTNALLAQGALCIRSAEDVFRLLPGGNQTHRPRPQVPAVKALPTDPVSLRVLDALEADPVHVDQLVVSSGLGLDEVSEALERLRAAEVAAEESGWWWRRR